MNLSDSPEEPDKIVCIICYNKINSGDMYAIIDNKHEKGKYHVNCLEKWLEKSNHGLLSQDEIKSYSVYDNDQIIQTNIINNMKPIQNKNENNNNNFNTYFVTGFFIIIFLIIMYIIYYVLRGQ